MFNIPILTANKYDSSIDLLKNSLALYSIILEDSINDNTLMSLNMDDIDFLESIQLIEKFIGSKINKKDWGPNTTIGEVVSAIDKVRE